MLHESLFNIIDWPARFSFADYYKGERELLKPALEAKGYQLLGFFFNVEADSFGPLMRGVTVIKDGKVSTFYYG